jgi:hypothetical protein
VKATKTTHKTLTKPTAVVSFFARVAVAFLLGLGFVFACDNGSAMITKAIESAVWLSLTINHKAKETICLY